VLTCGDGRVKGNTSLLCWGRVRAHVVRPTGRRTAQMFRVFVRVPKENFLLPSLFRSRGFGRHTAPRFSAVPGTMRPRGWSLASVALGT
jgi:hypothetical protein